jgi:hypothetical protein
MKEVLKMMQMNKNNLRVKLKIKYYLKSQKIE